ELGEPLGGWPVSGPGGGAGMTLPLFPTRTRRALLGAVDRGEVHRYGDGHDYTSEGQRRSYAVGELARAGWIVLGEPHPVKTPWLLTDAGREAMGGHRWP